jgi:hypothetical protein
MATIFPLSASVGQISNGYAFDGIAWNIIGENWKPVIYSPESPDYYEAGFIWVDSNEDVPEVNLSQYTTSSGYFTLSNKNIDGSANTFSNIPQNAITGLQDTLDNLDVLPSQSGNDGKYLTTSGSVASWGIIDLSSYLSNSSASVTYATKLELQNINGESDQFILPGQIYG